MVAKMQMNKVIEKRFWTVNRKLCLISMIVPTVVFWALMCVFKYNSRKFFIPDAGPLFWLLFSLHVIYPVLATKFLANKLAQVKIKKIKHARIGENIYTRDELQKIAITLVVMIFASMWITVFSTSVVRVHSNSILTQLILATPYLTFHIFCFIKNHSPSIIRALAAAPFSADGYETKHSNFSAISSSRAHEWGSRYSGTGPSSYHQDHYISRRY